MNGPVSPPGRRVPRMPESGVDDARVTRVIVQSENKLCNTCVRAENSSARLRSRRGSGVPVARARGTGQVRPGPGRVVPPRVYHRSRVTVVSALYPGSGRSRALTRALITAWSPQGDRQP